MTDIFKRNRTKQNGKRLKSFVLGCHEAINDFNHKKMEKLPCSNPLSSVPFWKRINRLRKNYTPKNIGILEVNGT